MNSNHIAQQKVPHSLKTLIYDCINNQHSQTIFPQSQYLLQINPSQEAEVYFFNSQLTGISNNLKIKQLSDSKCFVFSRKPEHYKIVTYCSSTITIYRAKVNQFGDFQQDFKVSKFSIKLQKNEQINYISSPIAVADKEIYIAYTTKDKFCLIQTSFQQGEYTLECVKLIDLDEPKGILSWFSKNQQQHYDTIELQLVYLSTGEQSIRVVSIRDYQIMVHLVQMKAQAKNSTIKVVSRLAKLSKIISNKCKLLDIVLLKNQQHEFQQLQKDHVLKFIAIFSDKQKNHLVNLQIFISQTEALSHCNLIQSFDSGFFFQIAGYFNTYFFSWFNQSTRMYTLTLLNEEQIIKISQQILNQTKSYLQEDQEFHLCKGRRQVFIFAEPVIFKYEPLESQLDQSQICLHNISNLKKKIYKPAQLSNYEQINKIMAKIEENYKQVARKHNICMLQYLSSFILRTILESNSLYELQSYIHQSAYFKETDLSILNEACKQTDQQHIKALLDFISSTKLFRLLIDEIICEASKQFCQSLEPNNAQIYLKILRNMFQDPINNALKQLKVAIKQKKQNLHFYKLLINSCVYFKQIEVTMLQPLMETNQDKFVKDLIVNHSQLNLFIHFFSKSPIQFDHSDLQALCKNAFSNDRDVSQFIQILLVRCKLEWKLLENTLQRKQYLQTIRRKVLVLLKGLQKYSTTLVSYLQAIYPGLAVYFYLKKDRNNRREKLQELAKRCQKPETSYILNLAAGLQYKESKQVLDNNRICHELKLGNLDTQMIVSDIKNTKLSDSEVKTSTWQNWKESHQNLSKDFDQMQKKLQLVRK